MKALASPRIVLFLYGSAFSWVHSKERFRERSYSVKSPSSPRKALCKVLVKSSFSMGALSHGCPQKSAFGSAFVNSYGALSERFQRAFGALSGTLGSAYASAFGSALRGLNFWNASAQSARKRSERFLIYRTSHRPVSLYMLEAS